MDAIKKLSLKGLFPKPKTQQRASSQSQLKKIIVVLRFNRHCKNCSREVKRSCEKTKGVTKVYLENVDDKNSQVTVEGAFDLKKLVQYIRYQNDKIVKIVEQRSAEESQEEEEDGSSSMNTSHQAGYDTRDDDIEIFYGVVKSMSFEKKNRMQLKDFKKN